MRGMLYYYIFYKFRLDRKRVISKEGKQHDNFNLRMWK